MSDIQSKDLPCYECLCLAACRGKSLGELMCCERAFNYVHEGIAPEQYPYVGERYNIFFRYMRLYRNYYKSD